MSFYTEQELNELGFKSLGNNVKISKKSSLYGCQYIEIGDNSRIDDFVVISAGSKGIRIGRHVHIAVFTSIIGSESIVIDDFSGLSSRVSVYSSSDDYSGNTMTNPTVNDKYKKVDSRPVYIGKHAIVGSGTIILPGVTLNTGVAVGALSLVTKSFSEFCIIMGQPAKKIKKRSDHLLKLERDFLNEQ